MQEVVEVRTDLADEGRSAQDAREHSVVALATEWLGLATARVQTTFQLALAQVKLAATSLVIMVFLAVVAAIFAMSAWGLLVAGLATVVIAAGIAPWVVLGVLFLLHVLGAWVAFRTISYLSANLEMSWDDEPGESDGDPA